MSANQEKTRQIITVVALVTTVVMNYTSNLGIFNNTNIGDLSDEYSSLFIPAGYVFAIWGVIYTGLFAYAIYQAQKPQSVDKDLRKMYPYFLLSCFFNITWLIAWLYQWIGLSLLLMIGILGSLIMIYLTLGIGRKSVSTWKKWTVHIPFSIYLGWITVATVANVTTYLLSINWATWGIEPAVWSVIMMAVATTVGILMIIRHRDIAYIGVLIWAIMGIYVAYNAESSLVGMVAVGLAGLLTVIALVTIPMNRKRMRLATN